MSTHTAADQMQSTLLQRVIATLDIFPISQAAVIQNVMSLTADLETGVDKLADALSTDQALTGKVIRLSNSPFYGRMRKVASLKEAILILGFHTIRSLVVATSTSSLFRRDQQDRGLEQDLWRHSLAVAIGSRLVARRFNSDMAEEAFLSGLLHDIAKLVLLQRFPTEYKPVLAEAVNSGRGHEQLEEMMLGFSHAELGQKIMEHWNFPPLLAAAARRHHQPVEADCAAGESPADSRETAVAHIVCLADALAKSRGFTFSEHFAADLASLSSVEFFGFDMEAMDELGDELLAGYGETEKCFE